MNKRRTTVYVDEKLYTALQSELIENGFLSKMFREEQAKAKMVKAVKKAES